jgi:hypothetical protein
VALVARYDLEAVANQSTFGDADRLAVYLAQNVDAPMRKLTRVTGLSKEQLESLLTSRPFRERLTEVMTYVELDPAKERKILRRMVHEATSDTSKFADFQAAASWVYRQGGMLRADKAQLDVGGSIRVAFTLDAEATHRPAHEGRYVAPDPLAGVVGLLPGSTEVPGEVTDVEFVPAHAARSETGSQGAAHAGGSGAGD